MSISLSEEHHAAVTLQTDVSHLHHRQTQAIMAARRKVADVMTKTGLRVMWAVLHLHGEATWLLGQARSGASWWCVVTQ